MQKILEIKSLYFSYRSSPILENVNLTIRKGDFLGIIGPNGGGKTTLLKLILGLLKPDSGEIRFEAQRLTTRHPRKMGYVPQILDYEDHFPITVRDIILTGRLGLKGVFSRYNVNDRKIAEKVIEDLGLKDFAGSCLCDLSGGERQRVLIARALTQEPSVMLLDEPTSNMDAKVEKRFYEILKELSKSMPVVIVSHDIGAISSHVNRIACLNRELVYHDSKELTQEMIEKAYHCPIDLIAHGVAHRVLKEHKE